MSYLKFHHIGIITKDVSKHAISFLESSIIDQVGDIFIEEQQGVRIKFGLDSSGILYEFIEPIDDESPISNALNQGKNIINHIGYSVSSLEKSLNLLSSKRAIPIGVPKPSKCFNEAHVQFVFTSSNVLIELIETDCPETFSLISYR